MNYSTLQAVVMRWHVDNGGHHVSGPAPHALRALRECVELCFACGATATEVATAVTAEVKKADERSPFVRTADWSECSEEFADTMMLLMVLDGYFGYTPENRIIDKFSVNAKRAWEADAQGVLWRPGHLGGPPAGTPPADGKSS